MGFQRLLYRLDLAMRMRSCIKTIITFKVRLDWTRSNAKQPKFDVIDSSRKVATARNLREQLRNIACLQAVVR